MIDDIEVRQSLGFSEEFSVAIDFSNMIDSERLEVANRTKEIALKAIYELILRLGQDPETYDESTLVVPTDESDAEYVIKRDLKTNIDQLAWINNFISSL
jgi:hypothetical protein